jgi:hypothetical protein
LTRARQNQKQSQRLTTVNRLLDNHHYEGLFVKR